ncbi:EF-P lysine aminoacylase EpmA [Phaeovulum vinaykumarii]|uniref:Lysyl-tRNA synthetase, class 2 n=1 Tax=Phaeovulum vinaykumarii TaxID=407234 RepID=A0A1N7L0L8_9RHOB|nr:EF-P lysine aminoacylase EpmA [Phaeovulum vinaykumarii]SIS67361.1 lysyl-tRNA synthetase, class 2 [Phaeovulum vinaykumarii]SOC00742.1 lysyl-tRNA synthetase class 2 [Phaeovulum vinaykumarii]
MTSGPNSPARPWWHRDRHEDRRGRLLARNRIQAAIRGWLAQEDFVEVDPLGLQLSPGNEAHLHAFSTRALGPDGTGRVMYLHTSPEFAMKKLLAAGETRIATFAHVWRNRERGPRHSPEFTLLEWYRAGADYTQLMADCTALCRLAARIAGAPLLRQGDLICDPFALPERLSVTDAFARHAGIDLLATLDAAGRPQPGAMEAALDAAGVRRASDDDWSDMFSRVLVERVEPRLGQGRLTFLDRYPLIEAALARPCPDDPRFAERFELYACGVELANGFGELTDADEQRRRFTHEMDLKQALYGERYPLDEEFLAALAQMPPAAGIALGFERLVMLATGAVRIDEVIWTPLA